MDSEYDFDFDEGSDTKSSNSPSKSASKVAKADTKSGTNSTYEMDFDEDFKFLEENEVVGENVNKSVSDDEAYSSSFSEEQKASSNSTKSSSTGNNSKEQKEKKTGERSPKTIQEEVAEEDQDLYDMDDDFESSTPKSKTSKNSSMKSETIKPTAATTNTTTKTTTIAGTTKEEEESYTPDFGNTLVSSPKGKEGVNIQKKQTNDINEQLKEKKIENKRTTDALRRRIAEIEAAINNANDPNNPMLLKIKVRKEIAGKRDFLENSNRKIEQELERYKEQEDNLLRKIEEIEEKIERKREHDEQNIKDHELDEQTFNASKETVKVGEENLTLSHKIQKAKIELNDLDSDLVYAKNLLKQTIGRKEIQKRQDSKTIDELTVYDLIQIYISIIEEEKELRRKDEEEIKRTLALSKKKGGVKSSSKGNEEIDENEVEEVERKKAIRELERRIHHLQEENIEMENATNALCLELQVSLSAFEDAEALKGRVDGMKERWHQEKRNRIRAQQNRKEAAKKLQILGDHIEKLLKFIKSEAVSRAKAEHWDKKARKELTVLKDLTQELQASTKNRDKTITALHHSTKLLEDQLRLTDGRYLLLREKLDYAKTSSVDEIRVANNDVIDCKGRYETIACVCKTMANGIRDFDIDAIRTIASKLNLLHKHKGNKNYFLLKLGTAISSSRPTNSAGRLPTGTTVMTDETWNTHDEFDDDHGYLQEGPESDLDEMHKAKTKPKQKKWLMPEYPDLPALVNAPDPEAPRNALDTRDPADDDSNAPIALWSSAKIDSIQRLLKDYGKTPIRGPDGSPVRVLPGHGNQED